MENKEKIDDGLDVFRGILSVIVVYIIIGLIIYGGSKLSKYINGERVKIERKE